MALVPATKEQKAEAEMARCLAWVAKLPEDERGRYCEHGSYWGFNGSLRFMSTCCKPTA